MRELAAIALEVVVVVEVHARVTVLVVVLARAARDTASWLMLVSGRGMTTSLTHTSIGVLVVLDTGKAQH